MGSGTVPPPWIFSGRGALVNPLPRTTPKLPGTEGNRTDPESTTWNTRLFFDHLVSLEIDFAVLTGHSGFSVQDG